MLGTSLYSALSSESVLFTKGSLRETLISFSSGKSISNRPKSAGDMGAPMGAWSRCLARSSYILVLSIIIVSLNFFGGLSDSGGRLGSVARSRHCVSHCG